MRTMRIGPLLLVASLLVACQSVRPGTAAGPLLVHNVFVELKDDTAAARQKLIDDCHAYLAPIPGIVAFAVGPRDAGLDREVNDLEFDIGLTIVFRDRAAHDLYQPHARHQEFIARNKDNFARVRVFDSFSDER
jgi:hypothetical protein